MPITPTPVVEREWVPRPVRFVDGSMEVIKDLKGGLTAAYQDAGGNIGPPTATDGLVLGRACALAWRIAQHVFVAACLLDQRLVDLRDLLDRIGPGVLGILSLLAHWSTQSGGLEVDEDELIDEAWAAGEQAWETRREIAADGARENPILGEEGGPGPGSMSAP